MNENELFLGKISVFKRKILNDSNVYSQNYIIKQTIENEWRKAQRKY